ncbi:MAG: PDZ domain-containing protein [Betaproteobacteria bacterium]|nr:MAG: PDZ domain-containing protein [Betaproteobacteria bacterium]
MRKTRSARFRRERKPRTSAPTRWRTSCSISTMAGVIWFTHEPGYVSLPFNRGGLRAIKEGPESFRVTLVLPGSPAAEAGIERNDQIVAIDGVQAAQMSGRDFTHKLVQPVGSELALKLRRGNEEREVRMPLIEMLP